MTSQAMNGYTPPTQYNFNLPDWRKTQTWQPPQDTWKDRMLEKYPLFPEVDYPFQKI